MANSESQILYSKNVLEFATVANEYCKFLEDIETLDPKKLIAISVKLLPLLYLKASTVPDFDFIETDEPDTFVTEAHYNYLHQIISEKLGLQDNLTTLEAAPSEGIVEEEEVTISECFTDIYQDLKNFTENYQTGVSNLMEVALWNCLYNFKHYWGIRLISVMSVLHPIFYNEETE